MITLAGFLVSAATISGCWVSSVRSLLRPAPSPRPEWEMS